MAIKPIFVYPLNKPWSVFYRKGEDFYRLKNENYLFHKGRHAIHWVFKSLKTDADPIAWIPTFHCGVEVQAVLDAGFKVGYYKVTPDLTVDIEDLYSQVTENPGPVLIIHYFGHKQAGIENIARLCEKNKVPLIEDCCHTIPNPYHSNAPGNYGDAAVYSLYKIMGTIDGGYIQIRSVALSKRFLDILPMQKARTQVGEYKKYLKRIMRNELSCSIVQKFRQNMKAISNPAANAEQMLEHERVGDYSERISPLSLMALQDISIKAIHEIRRSNYLKISAKLNNIASKRCLYGELEEGETPFVLAMIADRRTILRKVISDAGIETFVFGMYPHPSMGSDRILETRYLRDHIIGIPIHQQLTDKDIDHMVQTLNAAF